MRRRHVAAVCALGAALWSCRKEPAVVLDTAKPLDFTAKQKEILALVPQTAQVVFTVADPAGFLGRVNALKVLASVGPTGRKYVDKGIAAVREHLGFDPTIAAGWRDKGFDVEAPIAFFAHPRSGADATTTVAGVVFKPLDAKKAEAFIRSLVPALKGCTSHGTWAVCGDEGISPAATAGDSVWPRIDREVPASTKSAQMLLFAPLEKVVNDHPPKDAAEILLAQSKSVSVGMTFSPEQVVFQGLFANPAAETFRAFVTPAAGTRSNLGLAKGAGSVFRLRFGPGAIDKAVSAAVGPSTRDQALGAFQMVTGLDPQKDVIENLSGEILAIATPPAPGAVLVGTRDDERTKKLMERIDALADGAVKMAQGMMQSTGITVQREASTNDGRPVFTYKIQLPAGLPAAAPGTQKRTIAIQIAGTTVPGALVFAFDAASLAQIKAAKSATEEGVIAAIPSAHGQAALRSSAAIAGWGQATNPMAGMGAEEAAHFNQMLKAIAPDAPDLVKELLQMTDLVFDSSVQMGIETGGLGMKMEMTLL